MPMTGRTGMTTRTYTTSLCLSPQLESEIRSIIDDYLAGIGAAISGRAVNDAGTVGYLKNYWPKRLRNRALSVVTDEIDRLQKEGRAGLDMLKGAILKEWNNLISGVGTSLGGRGKAFVSSAQKLFGCSTNESSSYFNSLASAWNNKVDETGKFTAFLVALANADKVALANYVLTGYVNRDITTLLRGPDGNGPHVPFQQAVGWLNGMCRSKNMPVLFDRVLLKGHEKLLKENFSVRELAL